MTEPSTQAGRALLDMIYDPDCSYSESMVNRGIRAIEAEAAQGAAPLEVEAWVAGYVAGREDGPGQPDDEVAERAVDAVCALRMDDRASEVAASRAEGLDKNPGHEHVWRCDYCEATAPCKELRSVEAVKRAIRYVTDNEPYNLSLVKECARLANDVAARLSRPSDERVPESEERA